MLFCKAHWPNCHWVCSDFVENDLQHEQASRLVWVMCAVVLLRALMARQAARLITNSPICRLPETHMVADTKFATGVTDENLTLDDGGENTSSFVLLTVVAAGVYYGCRKFCDVFHSAVWGLLKRDALGGRQGHRVRDVGLGRRRRGKQLAELIGILRVEEM
jgi:hypothetical protein